MYRAPSSVFESVEDGEMKCRRCRSRFKDPNAFAFDTTYADCDSRRPVTRFPFALNGENAVIRVRDGYLALLVGSGGQRMWIEGKDCRITDMPGGIQVYYVCLSPQVKWGTSAVEEFGAYGTAQLLLSKDYAKSFCGADGRVQALEEHLRKLVSSRVTEFVRTEAERQNTSLLEHRDSYLSVLGVMEDGVSLTRIEPMGYRDAQGGAGLFTIFSPTSFQPEEAEPLPLSPAPADILNPPKAPYTIKDRTEEVFSRGHAKAERHKAGERVDADMLHGVQKVFRYRNKEFEFPFGWGLYNQRAGAGYYSAQGEISFFIDSTERFSLLLAKTASWPEFAEQFFFNVLKKEISAALREILSERSARKDFQPDRIGDYLSAMSVDLTNLLNGEEPFSRDPAFRANGLRVRRADILDIHFYSDWR